MSLFNLKNAWKTLVNPTVRLSVDFPFNPVRALKLYALSLLYFVVGSALPVGVFLLALRLMPTDGLLSKLLMAPGAEGLLLTIMSLATFARKRFGASPMEQVVHSPTRSRSPCLMRLARSCATCSAVARHAAS